MDNSKLFDKILNEATYHYNLESSDRSWFITSTGEIWSDVSHFLMLKTKFKQEWQTLKQKGLSDDEVENTFINRLLKSRFIKIGDLNDFYSESIRLGQHEKDALQGFCKSWLKVSPKDSNKWFHINSENFSATFTVGEIAADCLMKEN